MHPRRRPTPASRRSSVHGIVVGWAEMVDSLRPLLIKVALIALVSLSLGIAAYFMFATLPLKLLDRSLSELERANARFRQQNLLLDAALGNMFQGLAMFDAGERLVIANDRFAEMYGLYPGAGAARHAAAPYPRASSRRRHRWRRVRREASCRQSASISRAARSATWPSG